jgi:hypothetical protein
MSPNHHVFVAWTVHLHHEGHILAFLLDIIEVPEVWILSNICRSLGSLLTYLLRSHTGDTLGREFHNMLVEHGLENKVSLSSFISSFVLLTHDRFSHSPVTMLHLMTSKLTDFKFF